MATAPLDTVVRHLRRVIAAPAGQAPTDAELLDRFVRQRDAAAFELLVWRHQRLVFGVCRRVLRDLHDAEDAFQATFLTLVRKAGSISQRQALAGWLYQVAYRIACRAHANNARRDRREQAAADLDATGHTEDLVPDDLWPLLDREVQRLPAKYRGPVVLCYLEGKTYNEAARQLGCPKGTLATRLTRARDLLRAQLRRRGVSLAATALATALCEQAASAAAPGTLVAATVQAVTSGGALSAKVAALTEGVLQAMFWTKLKIALGVTLILAVLTSGGAMLLPGAAPSAQAQTLDPGPPKFGKGSEIPQPSGTWGLRSTWQAPVEITALALTADGKRVAAGGGTTHATVRIWDPRTGAEHQTLKVDVGEVRSLAFSPDGTLLAICGGQPSDAGGPAAGGLALVKLPGGNVVARAKEKATIVYASASNDGRHLLLITGDGTLKLLEMTGGKEIKHYPLVEARFDAVAFSPDGKILAASIPGSGIALVDAANGKVLRELAGQARVLAFSPDGKRLAATADGKQPTVLAVWDLQTGKLLHRATPSKEAINSVAFSPDGKTLATAGADHAVRLWDTASGKELTMLRGHEGPVTVVIFTPDGRLLISAGKDRTVRVWDTGKKEVLAKVEQPAPFGDRLNDLLKALLKSPKTDAQIIEALCLATMARLPTDTEAQLMLKHVANGKDRPTAFADILWALVNSQEFHTNVEALRQQDPRQKKQ